MIEMWNKTEGLLKESQAGPTFHLISPAEKKKNVSTLAHNMAIGYHTLCK